MPRKKKVEQMGRVMPDLPFFDPEEDAAAKAAAAKGEGDKVAELESRLAKLQEDQLRWMTMAPQPVAQTQQYQPVQPRLDMTGLPDPIEDKDKFATAVGDRVNRFITEIRGVDAMTAQQRKAVEDQTEALWEGFTAKYPNYAKSYRLVESAATDVINKATAKGVDARRYMFGATDQFYDDVKAELDNIIKTAGGTFTAQDDDGTDVDEPDDRTGGIFGGIESAAKPIDVAENNNDMFDDIRSWQTKNGFHR